MIKYRNATLDDVENIKKLSVELCEWESSEFDNKYNWLNPSTEEWIEIIKNSIKSDVYLVLIAEKNNKPIWFVLWWISKPAFYWNFDKLSELHKLYVKEEYRWEWIWDKLMEEFMKFSKENHVDRIEIFTFFDNDVNKFYEKYWFEKKALFLRKDLK